MAGGRKDVVQGTLDLLVLRIIAVQAMHGWGVMQRIRHLTDDVFQVTPGSLFPALRRLEENGWASGYWGLSENNRKARYYKITKAGRKQLERERKNWASITAAVDKVLEGA
jgi:PadR family transcriptional regulator PadR